MRSSRSRRADTAWLTARPYAHRGLHGPGRLENSRAAFSAAVESGFGIELDVQASRDGEALVFHDYELGRLAAGTGRLDELAADALRGVTLLGMEETIPTLPEVLRLIAGRCALLIEVKSRRRNVASLCGAVARALEDYAGHAAVMSFNPGVGKWFARHAPEIPRGLVISEQDKKGLRGRVERALSLWRGRADFLAYDVRDLPSPFAAAARARGLPILTWTVRSPHDEAAAAAYADQIIHELPQAR